MPGEGEGRPAKIPKSFGIDRLDGSYNIAGHKDRTGFPRSGLCADRSAERSKLGLCCLLVHICCLYIQKVIGDSSCQGVCLHWVKSRRLMGCEKDYVHKTNFQSKVAFHGCGVSGM